MTELTEAIVAFITAMFGIIFDILTPAATGATPLQVIVYAGFALAFVVAGVQVVKGLARG